MGKSDQRRRAQAKKAAAAVAEARKQDREDQAAASAAEELKSGRTPTRARVNSNGEGKKKRSDTVTDNELSQSVHLSLLSVMHRCPAVPPSLQHSSTLSNPRTERLCANVGEQQHVTDRA